VVEGSVHQIASHEDHHRPSPNQPTLKLTWPKKKKLKESQGKTTTDK
jgi:hypothetical protein